MPRSRASASGCTSTAPEINLQTHIDDVVNLILFEDLHDVVLTGHSYGGMVVTGVMDRVPERIRHVVFLDAAVPDDGMSLWDLFDGRELAARDVARLDHPDLLVERCRLSSSSGRTGGTARTCRSSRSGLRASAGESNEFAKRVIAELGVTEIAALQKMEWARLNEVGMAVAVKMNPPPPAHFGQTR